MYFPVVWLNRVCLGLVYVFGSLDFYSSVIFCIYIYICCFWFERRVRSLCSLWSGQE